MGAKRRDQARLNFGCRYCNFDASQKHEVVIHEASCEAKQKGTVIRTKEVVPVRKAEEKDQDWRENIGGLKVKVKCHSCPQVMCKTVLRKHLVEHHSPELPLGCDLCNYRALTKASIKLHTGQWHNAHAKTLPCTYGCGKYFADQWLVKYHVRRNCKVSPEAAAWKAERQRRAPEEAQASKARRANRLKARRQTLIQLGLSSATVPCLRAAKGCRETFKDEGAMKRHISTEKCQYLTIA